MKALLIVDAQKGFASMELEGIIPKVSMALKKEDILPIAILFRNDGPLRSLDWQGFREAGDQELAGRLEEKDPHKFYHDTYSIMTDELRAFLKKEEVVTVYLSGVYTDVCIKMAAMELFDQGYDVKVLEDCCASLHGKAHHDIAIDTLRHVLGDKNVISLEDL